MGVKPWMWDQFGLGGSGLAENGLRQSVCRPWIGQEGPEKTFPVIPLFLARAENSPYGLDYKQVSAVRSQCRKACPGRDAIKSYRSRNSVPPGTTVLPRYVTP